MLKNFLRTEIILVVLALAVTAAWLWLVGLIFWAEKSTLIIPAILATPIFASLFFAATLALLSAPFLLRGALWSATALAAWVFLFRFDLAALLVLPLIIALLWLASWRVSRYTQARLKFFLIGSGRSFFAFFFLALGLFLAAGAYISPFGSSVLSAPLPRSWYNISWDMAAPVALGAVGLSKDATVDEALLAITKPQSSSARPQTGNVTTQLPSQDQLLAQLRQDYGEKLGVPVEHDMKLQDLSYTILARQLDLWRAVSTDVILYAFILSAFFLWQTISIPLQWVTVFVAQILFVILKLAGVAKIEKVPAEREVLTFK